MKKSSNYLPLFAGVTLSKQQHSVACSWARSNAKGEKHSHTFTKYPINPNYLTTGTASKYY